MRLPYLTEELLTVNGLRDRESLFSKDVAELQWMAPHPWVFRQQKFDYMGYFCKGKKRDGKLGWSKDIGVDLGEMRGEFE